MAKQLSYFKCSLASHINKLGDNPQNLKYNGSFNVQFNKPAILIFEVP